MAEENDTSAEQTQEVSTGSTRKSARTAPVRRPALPKIALRLPARPVKPAAARPAASGARSKPVRSVVIVTTVAGLIATVALPAYAASRGTEETVTIQQVAADNAQSLVVASEATPDALQRYSYSATTPEEIEKKKAEEAAAERAKAIAAATAAAKKSGASSSALSSIDLTMTAPGSGAVRYPVTSFSYQSFNLFRPANRPNHNGFDMMTGIGTPIFAAADGVVRTSTDAGGAYGVFIAIDSVLNGQTVTTQYAHMTYGSRVVSAGQSVSAGQLIGQVGQTGSSTAPHLHFEVKINGSFVDPLAWLQANAG